MSIRGCNDAEQGLRESPAAWSRQASIGRRRGEAVIGSTAELAWTSNDRGGTITHAAAPEYLDDGPQKPIRIWSRTGRRPLLAGGNSNGDIQMLEYVKHADRPYLPLLLLHDDAEREFSYTSGAEQALELAAKQRWTVVSIKDDWADVFTAV